MRRGNRLVAGLAGVVLACAFAVPPARAQRCPYQMQMWYQVQMQQYNFHAQALQAQRFSAPTPIAGGTGFQSHRLQPNTFRVPNVSLHAQMRLTPSMHQSLTNRLHTLEPHPLGGHPLGRGHALAARPLPTQRLEPHMTLTRQMRPDLHLRLTTQFHTMTSRRPLESGHLVGHQASLPRVQTVVRSRPIHLTGQRPVVKAGFRTSCMGGCHFHQSQPVDVARIMPQQPGNPLLAQFLRMQRPPVAFRALPAPDPFLVQLVQRRPAQPGLPVRAGLPAGAPVRADLPPWLRALELPPALPPALLTARPAQPAKDQARTSVPDEASSPGAAIPPQGRVRIDPFTPAALEDTTAVPDLVRVVRAPQLPPSRGPGAQPLWPAPTVLAADAETETANASGLSPDDVLEAPALPPSPSAILPPPPLEEVVAELPAVGVEADPILIPPPLPSRSPSPQ
jgi:hypothetical protein